VKWKKSGPGLLLNYHDSYDDARFIKVKIKQQGVQKQGVEENIRTEEGRGNGRIEEIA